VTTTESRPTYLELDDELVVHEPAPLVAPREPRRRSGVSRRLPYAIAALTLAIGYAVGHTTNNPTPKTTAQPTLVTPQQINAALNGSIGHTLINDRGYSLLENGFQHKHVFPLPLSKSDQALLDHQMQLARDTALKYPTLADARKAGMFRAGPFSPGLGTHMVMPGNAVTGVGSGIMTDTQIEHPLAWIYDGTHPDSRIAGLFYQSYAANPAGFAGPNDVWHVHKYICIKPSPTGIDAPLGADNPAITKAACDAVGGKLLAQTGKLLHVWPVPGYEDADGVYAHTNPAITCDDGTYYTVDITKLGGRASACRDGTE